MTTPPLDAQRPPRPRANSRIRARTGSRLAAVQALFQIDQSQAAGEAVIDEFVRHRLAHGKVALEDGMAPAAAVPLFAAIVRGFTAQSGVLDETISARLRQGWTLDRMDPVLRALLRAASSEFFDPAGAPARVIIDEYLDVAHGFFGADEPAFVNVVLNSLARDMRPQEFAQPA